MGHYSIGAAKPWVGSEGEVVAVDLQDKMLEIAIKRAGNAGVAGIVTLHQCTADSIGYPGKVDFVIAGMSFMKHRISVEPCRKF